MTHIELPSPILRDLPSSSSEFVYTVTNREYLEIPDRADHQPLWDVLASRASRRTLGPIGAASLTSLLWYAAKTRDVRRDKNGDLWQSRPAPSGGGRHPIDLVVMSEVEGRAIVRLYDPLAHALCTLAIDQQKALTFYRSTKKIIGCQGGVILWFVAQFARTLSRYHDGESLVWRDAGALLATLYLVSEGLGLGCCGIGPTGDPDISQIFGEKDKLRGVGGCIVGSNLQSNDSTAP